MKNIIALLICFIVNNSYAQTWLDRNCKALDQTITATEFNDANKRNVLRIIINQAGEIEINGLAKPNLREIAFKELVLDFVTNPNRDKNKAENAEKVYVQLESYKKNSDQVKMLKIYIQQVYLYLWDKTAEEKYSSSYIELNCKKRTKIFNTYPLRIIGEVKTSKPKNRPKGIGVPPFAGDVNDN